MSQQQERAASQPQEPQQQPGGAPRPHEGVEVIKSHWSWKVKRFLRGKLCDVLVLSTVLAFVVLTAVDAAVFLPDAVSQTLGYKSKSFFAGSADKASSSSTHSVLIWIRCAIIVLFLLEGAFRVVLYYGLRGLKKNAVSPSSVWIAFEFGERRLEDAIDLLTIIATTISFAWATIIDRTWQSQSNAPNITLDSIRVAELLSLVVSIRFWRVVRLLLKVFAKKKVHASEVGESSRLLQNNDHNKKEGEEEYYYRDGYFDEENRVLRAEVEYLRSKARELEFRLETQKQQLLSNPGKKAKRQVHSEADISSSSSSSQSSAVIEQENTERTDESDEKKKSKGIKAKLKTKILGKSKSKVDVISAALPVPEKKPSRTNEAKRERIVHEILDTERSYVRSLGVLINHFVKPLQQLSIISKEQFKFLTSELEVIYNWNSVFLKQIDDRISVWTNFPFIGDLFLSINSYLKGYNTYTLNYVNAVDTYKICYQQINPFKEFVESFSKNEEAGDMNVFDFMIMPVQRIPRYVLLLQELLKYTDEDHGDYKNLQVALAKVKELADKINQLCNEAENTTKILSVQRRISGKVGPLLAPSRTYVKEGPLGVIDNEKKKEKRYFFLFNDVFIETKCDGTSKRSAKHVTGSSLGQAVVPDQKTRFKRVFAIKDLTLHDESSHDKHNFRINVISALSHISLTLCAQTKEEKENWMERIDECTKKQYERDASFILQRASQATS